MKHEQDNYNCFQIEVLSREEESYRMKNFGTCQMKEGKAHNVGLTLSHSS